MEDLSAKLLKESDQYAESLLWNNEYDQREWDDCSSDVSSGYESISLTSDTFSCSTEGFVGNQPVKEETEAKETEVMKFKSVQPLCDSLSLILSMPELCDVTFLVGPEQLPVYGVRAILGTRSRKFYELIIKHRHQKETDVNHTKKRSSTKTFGISSSLTDRVVIPVKKYDIEVFRNLVQFVHCGCVKITEETAPGLYCGGCQFELPDLAEACLDFIKGHVHSGSHETLLTATRSYSQHKASKTIFDMIYAILDTRYKGLGEVSK